MKKIFVLLICTIFLTGCPIGKVAKEGVEALPTIMQKIDETFGPTWAKIKNFFGGDDVTTVAKKGEFNFPHGLTHAIVRASIRKLCDEEGYDACQEISSWEIPKDQFEEEPVFEDKIAYFLSCVAIVTSDRGLGTGFFVEENKIVTNEHVVRNQKEVTIIQFYDHLALTQTDIDFKDFTANNNLIGNVERASQRNDIAIIKTSKPNPSVCNVSDLSPALLEDVVTVGHPKNLFYTVSKGSINAYRDKNQNFMANKDSMRVYSIHIDAPIYPGSSGGPLYFKGKVIGVNYGGYEDTTLNFSIHHNILKRYLN